MYVGEVGGYLELGTEKGFRKVKPALRIFVRSMYVQEEKREDKSLSKVI